MTILKAAIVICISLCNQEAEQEENTIDPCYLQWHREGRGPIYMLEYSDCEGVIRD